jgi:uncharacterized protein (DUF2461 family)
MRDAFLELRDVDPLTDTRPWFADLREQYEDLRERLARVRATYTAYAADLVYYADGDTSRPRFRPRDLAPPPNPCHPSPRSSTL